MTIEEMLAEEEGYRRFVYFDTVGKATIGIGRNVDAVGGAGLTEGEAIYLLRNDVQKVIYELHHNLPWTDDLDAVRKKVLLDMCFNLGLHGLLTFKNTLAHVKAGRYSQAAEGMLASKWARQVKGRAHRLAAMMKFGRDFPLKDFQ